MAPPRRSRPPQEPRVRVRVRVRIRVRVRVRVRVNAALWIEFASLEAP